MTDPITPLSPAAQQRQATLLQLEAMGELRERHQQRLRSHLSLLISLLDERGKQLSPIEFNGLLRLALRLRQEYTDLPGYPIHPHSKAWLRIDGVLDRAFLKPPAT